MTILELLIIIIILMAMYQFIKRRGHIHEWNYMYSTADKEYNWFYCEECMMQGCAKINIDTHLIEIEYFDTRKPWRKK